VPPVRHAARAGARAAGSKFVVMRNAAALLELGLCSWALQRAAAAGFTPTTTPDLVRASLLEKCGFQPRGDTTQARARGDPKSYPYLAPARPHFA